MTPKQFIKAYRKHGSLKAVARKEGMTWYAVRKAYTAALEADLIAPIPVGRKKKDELKTPEPLMEGRVRAVKTRTFDIPKRGVRRYLFTSAQNNTPLHLGLWKNLHVLAAHYNASVQVARFTYNKTGLGANGDKAEWYSGVKNVDLYDGNDIVWDDRIEPFLNDDRVEIAPGLVWCGEQNISPTAIRPLSGYETYTGRKSGIFPHVKFAMESIPSSKFEATKFNFTTGTVTQRNYIQRKAGLKAEFHHCYGALLVEVDSEGDWWCRQINADSEGTIYDLDVCVKREKLTTGNRVEGITWGDIHVLGRSSQVNKLMDEMVTALNPRFLFYHDILDFRSRNHHEARDPFRRLKRHIDGHDSVYNEIEYTMEWLANKCDHWDNALHVVVDSNHDRALERWLRESDWRHDPLNMQFFLQSALAKVDSIVNKDSDFHLMRHWFNKISHYPPKNVKFLDEDESFVLCRDDHGGIECGMHGHLGPNGRRGSPGAFAKMGRKANIGHFHTAQILDGVYVAGCSCKLDQEYNVGPSSWSWSHVVTYANGKRAIVTMWNGKWRA